MWLLLDTSFRFHPLSSVRFCHGLWSVHFLIRVSFPYLLKWQLYYINHIIKRLYANRLLHRKIDNTPYFVNISLLDTFLISILLLFKEVVSNGVLVVQSCSLLLLVSKPTTTYDESCVQTSKLLSSRLNYPFRHDSKMSFCFLYGEQY